MANGKTTKRAQQAIETKKRIIRCAKRLINKKGFENISVAQISEEASISIGTFYYYFTSKEDLLYEVLPRISSYLESDMAQKVKNAASYVKLMTFFRWLFEYPFSTNREIVKRILVSEEALKAIDQDRLNILEEIVRRGQEAGEFTMRYNSLYIAKMLLYANRGLFYHYMIDPTDYDYFTAAQDVMGRLAYSYLTGKGRESCPKPEFVQ